MTAPAAPLPGETCPGQSTWDQTPPTRPGTATFNGASLQNANSPGVPPPHPGTHPTAALLNTWSFLDISVGAVVPNALVSVAGGASPQVAFVSSCGSAVVRTSFTLTRVSAGIVTVAWVAGLLPTPVAYPSASLACALTANSFSIACLPVTFTGGTASTTVYTNVNGVPTDLSFVLAIL